MIWFAAALALLAGIGIGAAIALWLTPAQKRSRDLARLLDEKTEELKNYQQEVTSHFSKTATLLGDLANSYRDVHNHLAQGAQQLCPTQLGARPILARLGDDDEKPVISSTQVTPPLDYAPRSSNPFKEGTLSEGYGLEKKSAPANPADAAMSAYAETDEKHD